MRPRLSPVRVGSVRVSSILVAVLKGGCEAGGEVGVGGAGGEGMVNFRVRAPIAVRPLRSLRRCEALCQIRSRVSSSASHWRGLAMMRVRYWGMPSGLMLGFVIVRSLKSQESGTDRRSDSVESKEDAEGF